LISKEKNFVCLFFEQQEGERGLHFEKVR